MDFPFTQDTHSEHVEKVARSIRYICPVKTDESFAQPILIALGLEDLIVKIDSLSRRVQLITANQSQERFKNGTVCVFEVDVRLGSYGLEVLDKNSSNKYDFFRVKDIPKAILIHSKSVYVVDAKLKVYDHFKSEILSGNIFLQHVFDGYEEISKICAHHSISTFSEKVNAMKKSIPVGDLPNILSLAADRSLSETNLRHLCHNVVIKDQGTTVGKVGSASYSCRFMPTVNRLKQELMKETLDEAVKSLASEISKGILVHIESKILEELEQDFKKLNISISSEMFEQVNVVVVSIIVVLFNELKTLIMTVVTFLVTIIIPIDINSTSWRNKVAEEIYNIIKKERNGILDKTIQKIRPICERTVDELMNVYSKLEEGKRDLRLVPQERDVEEWGKKRDIMKDVSKLKDYPSVLTFIAGRKYGSPHVKVFLKFEDEKAKSFLKSRIIPFGTSVEFVNVTERFNTLREENIQRQEEKEGTTTLRNPLYEILEKEEEKIYAKHSSVVAIEANQSKLYFTLYCLDKFLIPFGEEPLPNQLSGYPCFVKEDIVRLGYCDDCRELNPGCSIGLPWTPSTGSVGFLARSNNISLPVTGFLTAAHVAIEEYGELFTQEIRFSESYFSNRWHYVVHPSLPDSANSTIIGNVVDSFCGNYNSVGIDAAFVKVYQPRKREQVVMRTASEHLLCSNGKTEVVKYGRATLKTKGILYCLMYSCKVDSLVNGYMIPRVFRNCYSIADQGEIFFREGDSGSGVYLIDRHENQLKPLGIAFAFHIFNPRTAVCKIKTILQVLNVSIVKDRDLVVEEDMDTS
ncbi:uncharacterized protein LOC133180409 [Saccostrea echinata]|uniref:uncharacterized protein LOC133180409 n=1 Tax=Saccostrea echinata TaxID=191078 RepID=UPI002A8230F0|nr:uncharacterized protein LOC133180409 [Saccostrea echinata]